MQTTLLLSSLATACSASPNIAKTRLAGVFNARPDSVLACPTTKTALQQQQRFVGSVGRAVLTSDYGVRYPVNEVYADLLPSAATPLSIEQIADELRDVWGSRMQTGLFRTPLMAFLYERGWRQQFEAAGFPGVEMEYAMMMDYCLPVATGGTVVDMSCGSGLMTRQMLLGGQFGRVVALDYSEAVRAAFVYRVYKSVSNCTADPLLDHATPDHRPLPTAPAHRCYVRPVGAATRAASQRIL